MKEPLSFEAWRAYQQRSLREAREAGESVTDPLEGQPESVWRAEYAAYCAVTRAFAPANQRAS